MTSQAERTSLPGPVQPSPVTDDRDEFADMFDAHAQHLFDYCCCLLGDQTRAASATQVTLIAAHSLAGRLKDTDRMRAFVLALGRWECLSGEQVAAGPDGVGPPGTEDLGAALAFVDQPDDVSDADPGELTLSDFEISTGLSLRAMLEALPREHREILDLIYRHDVSMADLALLIGVPAASAPGMLAAAKAKFAAQARGMSGHATAGPASPDVRAEELSAVRLLTLPGSVWRRTARVVMDPRFSSYREAVSAHAEHLGPDGFPVQPAATPSRRKLVLASVLMAGLLLAPAAVGGAGYAAFSTIAHVTDHHSTAVTPSGPTSAGSVTGGTSGAGRAHSAGGGKRAHSRSDGNPVVGPAPQPPESATAPPLRHHKPSSAPTPVPTSRYSSSSSPWPTQTATSPASSPTSSSPPTSPPPSSSSAAATAATSGSGGA